MKRNGPAHCYPLSPSEHLVLSPSFCHHQLRQINLACLVKLPMRIFYEEDKTYVGSKEGSGEKQRVTAQLVFIQPPNYCKLKNCELGEQR